MPYIFILISISLNVVCLPLSHVYVIFVPQEIIMAIRFAEEPELVLQFSERFSSKEAWLSPKS